MSTTKMRLRELDLDSHLFDASGGRLASANGSPSSGSFVERSESYTTAERRRSECARAARFKS